MAAPEWRSFLSIVDGSLNRVPVSDLDPCPPGSQEKIRVLLGHYYEW